MCSACRFKAQPYSCQTQRFRAFAREDGRSKRWRSFTHTCTSPTRLPVTKRAFSKIRNQCMHNFKKSRNTLEFPSGLSDCQEYTSMWYFASGQLSSLQATLVLVADQGQDLNCAQFTCLKTFANVRVLQSRKHLKVASHRLRIRAAARSATSFGIIRTARRPSGRRVSRAAPESTSPPERPARATRERQENSTGLYR